MNVKTVIFIAALVQMSIALNGNLITNFTINLIKTQQAVVLGCNNNDLLTIGRVLTEWNQAILLINLNRNFSLRDTLTRHNHAKTSVLLDCTCPQCEGILQTSSEGYYFNKTYQWMIWDPKNVGVNKLMVNVINTGPNSQITYVNMTGTNGNYSLYDVHSKGGHLNAPLEVVHCGDWQGKLIVYKDIFKLQGIQHRQQFNQLTLRGGIVNKCGDESIKNCLSILQKYLTYGDLGDFEGSIDRDNITTNEQIISLLEHITSVKVDGVAPFIKYYYGLLSFLQERFNFTVNYRNARGWAGRLGSGTFRLGFLGIMSRNEIDIGASGAFNRINRFAEYDTIHQSWKFDAAFLYRFTTDVDTDGRSGNFLAPFETQVWAFSCATLVLVIVIWGSVVWLKRKQISEEVEQNNSFLLETMAAICQQGLDPIPTGIPSRTIVLTMFVFSLVMYNFYTSSVVGGLLSSSDQGPKTIAEIVNSPLKLSFEDIGYYKVLFKELKSPIVRRMYKTKVLPKRSSDELQVFTHMKEAIPYVKKGGYAFHCELVDAYPEIARLFDANEICDLRVVSGLLERELLNWIVPKNSKYTEVFRIMMCRARETGIVDHTLTSYSYKRPRCQSTNTVYPVAMPGVQTAFALLGAGMVGAVAALTLEIIAYQMKMKMIRINKQSRRLRSQQKPYN